MTEFYNNKENKEFFLKLYEEQSDKLFRHCFFRVSDREKALDLVQESFLRVWKTMQEDKTAIRNLSAFLYRVANNLIIDHYRKHKSLSVEKLEEENPGVSLGKIEGGIEENAEVELLLQALEKISSDQKQVFIMRHIDGLSVKEIAKIVGCSENLASVRLNRARSSLRKILNVDL